MSTTATNSARRADRLLFDVGADPAARFAGWVRRPNFRGRAGWEVRGLPEWQCWWHRCDFEDLPTETRGTFQQAN